MTLPNLNTDQKSAGADAYSISGDETRSTIGLHPSELAPSMISSTSHLAAIQSMKFSKTIALACLGLTVILGLFVMVNTGYQRCDCRYPGESGLIESRSNSPFFEPLVSSDSTGDPNGKSKRLPIRIQMEGDASELMKKNKKGRVNCSVERKTATQIIASEPKLLITPYGNITTDPRIIHMVGEKMIFTCTTGKDKNGRNGFKDKLPKKYGTVINLNELEKDEKAAANSIIGPSTTTTVPSEPTEARPKRSANEEPRSPSKRVTCDCHCPHEG